MIVHEQDAQAASIFIGVIGVALLLMLWKRPFGWLRPERLLLPVTTDRPYLANAVPHA